MPIQVTILNVKEEAQLIDRIKREVATEITHFVSAFTKAFNAKDAYEEKMAVKYVRER